MADDIAMIKGSEIREAALSYRTAANHASTAELRHHLNADKLGIKRYSPPNNVEFLNPVDALVFY